MLRTIVLEDPLVLEGDVKKAGQRQNELQVRRSFPCPHAGEEVSAGPGWRESEEKAGKKQGLIIILEEKH